ncbi:MAG: alpha/beta hydrolase [Gammaproteobacteria bacterium]
MRSNIIINSDFQKLNAIITFNPNFDKQPLAIMLHGFASNKHEAGNTYDKLSESLLKNGIASLQIDFGGWGENPINQLNQFSIDSMLRNVEDSIKAMSLYSKIDRTKMICIGFSLGSSIALISQEEYKKFSGLILISPSCNLRHDFTHFLGDFGSALFKDIEKGILKEHDKVAIPLDWRDYPIIPISFFTSFNNYNIQQIVNKINVPVFCIAGSEDFSARHANEMSKNKNVTSRIIQGADHIFHMFTPEKSSIDQVIAQILIWSNQLFDI